MVFCTFWGDQVHELGYRPSLPVQIPLVVLGVLSIFGGLINVPGLVESVLPRLTTVPTAASLELVSSIATAVASLLGILIAYWAYVLRPQVAADVVRNPTGATMHHFWFVGWGFDWLYDRLIVHPFMWLAGHDRDDVVDLVYQGIAGLARLANGSLAQTETGRLRYYAMGIALGAVLTVAVAVLLWY